ncbi:MAG: DUF547 domain-containing protein [Gillisia sp.]
MKKYISIPGLLLILWTLSSFTGCNLLSSAGFNNKGLSVKEAPKNLTSTTANSAVHLDHSAWTKLLQKYVDAKGFVDYRRFMKDKPKLEEYIRMLASQQPAEDWSVQEQLAYYINAYNANTIKLILDHYPIKSIKDIDGPWTKERVKIGDKMISLGGLENSILRKMNEPRIHFAINCASISCPKLQREAYTAAKINEQLDRAADEFINSDKNEISANSAKLSSIFKFYTKDFKNMAGSLVNYLNKFSDTKLNKNADISFKDYNWNLNEQK